MKEQDQRKKIFLVDDNITNLTVGKNALADKYTVYTIPSGDKLLIMLEKIRPDLILLDVEMPGMNGYDTIKAVKNRSEWAEIPVIFLTAMNDGESELEGLTLGALDYVSKPFSPPLLNRRLEVHLMVEQQKTELKAYRAALLDTLVNRPEGTLMSHTGNVLKYIRIYIDAILDAKADYYEEVSKWNWDSIDRQLRNANSAVDLNDGNEKNLLRLMVDITGAYSALISGKSFGHDEAVRIINSGSGTHFDPILTGIFIENEKKFADA